MKPKGSLNQEINDFKSYRKFSPPRVPLNKENFKQK
jgi:hypothetical protein